MKLTPFDKNKLNIGYKPTTIFNFLNEFKEMDCDCVKVEDTDKHYKNIASAQGAFHNSIKHFKMHGIEAISRGGVLYLIKTEGEQ